jgi:hypothetical protein
VGSSRINGDVSKRSAAVEFCRLASARGKDSLQHR